MRNSKINSNAYPTLQGFQRTFKKKIDTIISTLDRKTKVGTGCVSTLWQKTRAQPVPPKIYAHLLAGLHCLHNFF